MKTISRKTLITVIRAASDRRDELEAIRDEISLRKKPSLFEREITDALAELMDYLDAATPKDSFAVQSSREFMQNCIDDCLIEYTYKHSDGDNNGRVYCWSNPNARAITIKSYRKTFDVSLGDALHAVDALFAALNAQSS